jgi:SAM-dependent methyltransferase
MHGAPDLADRERLRRGELREAALLAWLSALPPRERDRRVERLLGIDGYPLSPTAPGAELTGYVPSGVSAIVRTVFEVPIRSDDVFVDLGAGLGKAAMLVHLLSGARARGVEVQRDLAARARAETERLGLTDVRIDAGDARDAAIDDGTIFFLYLPFTGSTLATVLDRLRAVAERRRIVICTLGLDLRNTEAWLTPRPTDAFWLSIYDSHSLGVPPEPRREPRRLPPVAAAVAFERPADP